MLGGLEVVLLGGANDLPRGRVCLGDWGIGAKSTDI